MRVGWFSSPSAPPAYAVWRMEIGLRAAVSYSPSASSVASHSSERVAFLLPSASRSTLGTCPFRMYHSKSVEVAYYWISHNTAKMHYRCHLSLFFFTRSAFPFACYHLRCTCNFLHQTLFVIIDSGWWNEMESIPIRSTTNLWSKKQDTWITEKRNGNSEPVRQHLSLTTAAIRPLFVLARFLYRKAYSFERSTSVRASKSTLATTIRYYLPAR